MNTAIGQIDLRQCKPGDVLVARDNTLFTYVRAATEEDDIVTCTGVELGYYHIVRYPNGSEGTRYTNGSVFNTTWDKHDIVAVYRIPKRL